MRIAEPQHSTGDEDDDGVRALDPPHRGRDGVFGDRLRRARDEMGDDLAVGRPRKLHPARLEFRTELGGVDEISVVGQGQRSPRGGDHERLRVLQPHRAHRRVAHMPDGQLPGQPRNAVGVEDLEHQAHPAMVPEAGAIACGDACTLLPAMLQRIQSKVRHRRGRAVPAHDPDHAALFSQNIINSGTREPGNHGTSDRWALPFRLVPWHPGTLVAFPATLVTLHRISASDSYALASSSSGRSMVDADSRWPLTAIRNLSPLVLPMTATGTPWTAASV